MLITTVALVNNALFALATYTFLVYIIVGASVGYGSVMVARRAKQHLTLNDRTVRNFGFVFALLSAASVCLFAGLLFEFRLNPVLGHVLATLTVTSLGFAAVFLKS